MMPSLKKLPSTELDTFGSPDIPMRTNARDAMYRVVGNLVSIFAALTLNAVVIGCEERTATSPVQTQEGQVLLEELVTAESQSTDLSPAQLVGSTVDIARERFVLRFADESSALEAALEPDSFTGSFQIDLDGKRWEFAAVSGVIESIEMSDPQDGD